MALSQGSWSPTSGMRENWLVQIDDSSGSNTKYYFHNGVSENNNGNLIFDNVEYTRMPIEAEGFDYSAKQLPRPTLRISNILGTITSLLLTLPSNIKFYVCTNGMTHR